MIRKSVPRNNNFLMTLSYQNTQMPTNLVVGVLALQGAFYEHIKLLKQSSSQLQDFPHIVWDFLEIRTSEGLVKCDALIIPGGESTTVALVAARSGLLEPLRDFVK